MAPGNTSHIGTSWRVLSSGDYSRWEIENGVSRRAFDGKLLLTRATCAPLSRTESVEGNYYFPPDSVKTEHFIASD